MTEFTLNTLSDVQILASIFNGQAMLVSNLTAENYYWVAIVLAALAGTFFAVVTKLSNVDNKEAMSAAFMNFMAGIILVMMYTGYTGRVLIQSERDGTVKAVDNVPVMAFVVPVLMSNLSIDFARIMETAYQPPFADYTMLGGTGGQTFGEPLRALLSTRTALQRLPQIQSDLREIVGSCLDSSYNYGKVNLLVSFAGDTASGGASSAASTPIMGLTIPTSVGALLYQASQNMSAFVPGMTPPSASIALLSCPDAVNIVVAEIDAAFGGAIFASNGTRSPGNAIDAVSKTDYTFDVVSSVYNNLRNFAAVTGTNAIGSNQAMAEMVNLIFNQELMWDLNCLKHGGADKSSCLGNAVLANSIEQGNIDNAANGSAFLATFGAFADSLFAVIIGLTPVYVIVMVFLGRRLVRMMYAYMQTMLWSVLVYNFGAVLVNSIILYKISTALQAIAGGTIINQVDGAEVYRTLSMQVGAAASMLTSLTMLVPTLFTLSQSATMAGVASKSTGQDRFNEKVPAPDLVAPNVVQRISTPLADTSVAPSGQVVTKASGALDNIQSRVEMAKLSNDYQESAERQARVEHSVSDRVDDSNSFAKRVSQGNFETDGLRVASQKAIQQAYSEAERAGHSRQDRQNADFSNQHSNTAAAGLSGKVGASTSGGPSAGLDASLSGTKESRDQTQADVGTSVQKSAETAYARDKNVQERLEYMRDHAKGTEERTAIEAALQTVKAHAVSDSDVQSITNATRQTASVGNSLTAMSNALGDTQIAHATAHNPALGRLMNDKAAFDDLGRGVTTEYNNQRKFMDSGNTAQFMGPGAEQTKHNVAMMRTLSNIISDPKFTPEQKMKATRMLSQGVAAVIGTATPEGVAYQQTPKTPENPWRTTNSKDAYTPATIPLKGGVPNSLPTIESIDKQVDGAKGKIGTEIDQRTQKVDSQVAADQAIIDKKFGKDRAKAVSGLGEVTEERPTAGKAQPEKPSAVPSAPPPSDNRQALPKSAPRNPPGTHTKLGGQNTTPWKPGKTD
jgi:hypothetical protein